MIKNKEKLKKVLNNLLYKDSGLKSIEKDMARVMGRLKEDAEIKTVEMAKRKIAEIKGQVESIKADLTNEFNKKLFALKSAISEYRGASLDRLSTLSSEINELKKDIREISNKKIEIPDFENQILKVEKKLEELMFGLKEETEGKVEDILIEFKKIEEEIKKLRRDTMSAMAGRVAGGGNMNRNILVGNNPSTLGRYTDLNILAGSNVTLSYTNNDNLKTTNLTIAATGGGSNRNISTVSVSSVVAAVASTDYVIIAGAGIQLTLPTAVGNTNLYTIKNKVASSVLVNTTGGQTIDDDTNIILATRYTAVDLISDNANWHIT